MVKENMLNKHGYKIISILESEWNKENGKLCQKVE